MQHRRGTNLGIGLCGLVMLAMAGSAWAGDAPFVGHWHWNRAESKLPAGEPVPADLTADFTRVDNTHVKWRITVTSAQGQKSVESFDTPANGEFYPINSDTTASFHVNGGTLQAIFKGAAGQSDTLTCTLSADQRKMTCNGALTGTDGKTETSGESGERFMWR